MHEFGLTREQLAQVALNGRRNAAVNPKAVYRDPMDLATYLGSRMISTPLCLFDCDAPSDGSTALVVSHRDHAPDTPHPVCHVNAVGTALRGPAQLGPVRRPHHHGRPGRRGVDVGADRAPARRRRRGPALRRVLDPRPGVAGGAGLLRPGGERRLRRGRGRPSAATARYRSTPPGASCPGGRLHGFGLIHEACVQLRGDGGERQVRTARGGPPEVAAVSNGGGPDRRLPAADPRPGLNGARSRPGERDVHTRWRAALADRVARVSVGP